MMGEVVIEDGNEAKPWPKDEYAMNIRSVKRDLSPLKRRALCASMVTVFLYETVVW